MTIDFKKVGPARYRTNANSNFELFCYFGQNNKDRLFNKFLAKRVDTGDNSLIFKIYSVINVTKNRETKIYKAVEELKSLEKYNSENGRSSNRQQCAVECKLADRKYFGRGSKNGGKPKFLS